MLSNKRGEFESYEKYKERLAYGNKMLKKYLKR